MLKPTDKNPQKNKNRGGHNVAIGIVGVKKRTTTGRNSLKTKNQTSVKKGGHAENQRNKNFQSKNHRIPLLREWLLL